MARNHQDWPKSRGRAIPKQADAEASLKCPDNTRVHTTIPAKLLIDKISLALKSVRGIAAEPVSKRSLVFPPFLGIPKP